MNKTNNKASVFILLGQSNAVGHGIPMTEEDKIIKPLTNVFGLSRELNQSFDNQSLTWTGYTSGGMNLAEEQDHTYSIANCLAKLWQKAIDTGVKLPDLHIIQIAIGAEGVSERYMWYPKREKKLIPGKLGTVNISLFPYTQHIFSLLDDSFKRINKEYEIIGLHWRGGCNEVTEDIEYLKRDLFNIYQEIFDSFNALLNSPPTVIHKIIAKDRMHDMDPTGKAYERMLYINEVFNKLETNYPNISIYDPSTVPQYIPNVRGNGVFIEDAVHFTPEVNNWIAGNIFNKYREDQK